MKQVAVRMSSRLHKDALEAARREGISFGELVRRCVDDHCAFMRKGRGK